MPPSEPAVREKPSRIDALAAWAALAACYVAYLAIFLPLLPAGGVGLGHDYSLHLPNLLAGYFFFLRNGLWSVPWFSPGECGGVPFLADLNVGYYSLPQFLTFVVDPLIAVRVTFAVFAAVGGLGAYALARARFHATRAAAVVAAVLFLFNGFYAYRVIIGHLTFHPIMLVPWLAFVLLPGRRPRTFVDDAVAAVIGGALLAYMFQAGMIHGMVPVTLAVTVVLLAHGQIFGHAWRPWVVLAGAVLVSVALSATRLTAAFAFLQNFPRTDYPLPGFASLWQALRFAAESLFWIPSVASGWNALVNTDYFLDRHEWEYGLGPAAAVLIAGGGLAVAAAWARRDDRAKRLLRALPVAIAVGAILAIPIGLNWYAPGWNAFLKGLPLLASSSSLLRWFMLYVPLAALFAGLAVDRAISAGARIPVMLAVVAAVVAFNAVSDKSFYAGQRYDARAIVAAWRSAASGGEVPAIAAIALPGDGSPAMRKALGRGDALAAGRSQLFCYQPMFGYELEHFDATSLHAGPIADVDPSGNLNLKNPACYLYPEENRCRPGADFPATGIAAATAFAAYQPFPFQVSPLQRAANWLNLAALVGCAAALGLLPLRRRRAWLRLDANPPSG